MEVNGVQVAATKRAAVGEVSWVLALNVVAVAAAYVTRSTKSFFTEGSVDTQDSYRISRGNNRGRPGRRKRG